MGPESVFVYAGPVCTLTFKAQTKGIFQVLFEDSKVVQNGYDFAGLAKALDKYFSGQPVQFTEPLIFDKKSFAGQVLSALLQIPFGRTVSYRELAEKAGYPGAARAVGTVMANNPLPLLIPCHRVILADGRLGNFGPGQVLKKQLLKIEGICLDK